MVAGAVAPGPPTWLEGARYCAILCDIVRECAILCDTVRYLAINHELAKILAKAGLTTYNVQPERNLVFTIFCFLHFGIWHAHARNRKRVCLTSGPVADEAAGGGSNDRGEATVPPKAERGKSVCVA